MSSIEKSNKQYAELLAEKIRIEQQIKNLENGEHVVNLHKIEGYIIDFENESIEDLVCQLQNSAEASIHIDIVDSTRVLWDDDIDINMNDATKETYEKYFNK